MDRGCRPCGRPDARIDRGQYLDLVRWSWAAGQTPPVTVNALPGVGQRIVEDADRWIRQLEGTERHYGHAVGALDALLQRATLCGRRWLKGIGLARLLAKQKLSPA